MSSSIFLSKPPNHLEGKILLPGSKSESNRALILQAQSGRKLKLNNLSTAEDTVCLEALLKKMETNPDKGNPLILDVGPAGTVMRFLTAHLSLQEGEFILTGSVRMLERPIKVLVEALQNLGADIEYLGNPGFPPIRIRGKKWTGKKVSIPANISSQYLSALLLIAPSTIQGLEIEMEGELTSAPYVHMTVDMMEGIGLKVERKKNGWFIAPQSIPDSQITVEPDWSSASYWYSLAHFAPSFQLILPHLRNKSLQADRKIVEFMKPFGIQSQFTPEGVVLSPCYKSTIPHSLDFKTCPDIAQTVIVCAAGSGYNIQFDGLETLKIKETDRVEALKKELKKLKVSLISSEGSCELNTEKLSYPEKIYFETYHDHRMALALAPLVYHIPQVEIENHEVINKSYPSFWKDLETLGFKIKS